MKKGAIFVGLILFSFVLIGSFGVVSGEEDVPTIIPSNPDTSNYVTETITCKFNDIKTGELLTERSNCFNSFHYGNIEIPTEEVVSEIDGHTYTAQLQYQCSNNEGECSITIRGERGAKMKWSSFCMENVLDKSWGELASDPDLTTTIDGTDKVVELEGGSQSFAGLVLGFISRIWSSLF
ncbi:MAG TPA: hypothetical protein VJ208_01550, partial [Candidatus Nanoarchaeia archaeon]|nr:hypothetical protein [Candidatus Nanoarchaeia archaeon]